MENYEKPCKPPIFIIPSSEKGKIKYGLSPKDDVQSLRGYDFDNHNLENGADKASVDTKPNNINAYPEDEFDYSTVLSSACVAVYNDMKSAPRIITIDPATTNEFIESLASTVYQQSQNCGGNVPYTVIREVTENFIHAQFKEIVVSILDKGNTIRFADQGPGIKEKEKAQLPGFTSAIAPMKQYIRGVGSGLPIVKEYLAFSNGSIRIEDNLEKGAVVTISMTSASSDSQSVASVRPGGFPRALIPTLSDRERTVLPLFLQEGALGVTDIVNSTGIAQSTVYNTLRQLEENGLIEKTSGKKRILTDLGFKVAQSL